MLLKKWWTNKIIPIYVFFAITTLLLYFGRNIHFGNYSIKSELECCIEFNYYGMNNLFLEKEITIPFEKKLSTFKNLSEIKSVTEENKVTFYLCFDDRIKKDRIYQKLSKEIDDFYKTLKYPIQKPKIFFDNNENYSDLLIAIYSDDENEKLITSIQKELLPLIESINEVSRVNILGNKNFEVNIFYNNEIGSVNKIPPQKVAYILQKQNPFDLSTTYATDNIFEKINTKTQFNNLAQWENLSIKQNDQYIKLSDIAKIKFSEKEAEEIVKINNEKCIEIEIKSKSNSNKIILSKKCRKVLKSYFNKPNYKILFDAGNEQYENIKKIFFALLQSIFIISLFIPFVFLNKKITIIIIICLSISLIWSLLLISAIGFPINQYVIAGMSISLGIIIDPFLLLTELRINSKNLDLFFYELTKILPSLLSSTGTNLIVFLPFFFVEKILPGISIIVLSMIIMISISFIIAISFYTCFLVWIPFLKKENKTFILKKINLNFSKKICFLIYSTIIFSSIISIFILKKDVSFSNDTKILYANIEYNPEKRKEIIDESVSSVISNLLKNKSIETILSICKKGNCELKIIYDKKSTNLKELKKIMDEIKINTKEGFVFIDDGIYNKKATFNIEVTIEGLNSKTCRKLAKEFANKITGKNKVHSVVLNFKEEEKIFSLKPNNPFISLINSTPFEIAENLYWKISSPVINKFYQNGKEYDIKFFNEKLTFDKLLDKQIFTDNAIIKINDIGTIETNKDIGKIYRKNNRNCAFLTVTFNNCQLDKAKSIIHKTFIEQNTPENYSYSLDRKTMQAEENNQTIQLSFVISIALLFVLLCALNEKPFISLLIISIIPASFCLPLLLKVLFNQYLGIGDYIGMAVAAGLVINNAILIEALGIKKNQRKILLTNITTILGSIPMLFLGDNNYIKDLSFYMFFSMLGALIISLVIFPKIISYHTLLHKDS